MSDTAATVGHNKPPSALIELEEIPAFLADTTADLNARIEDITNAFARWKSLVEKPRVDANGDPVKLADGTLVTEIKIDSADINKRSIDFARKTKGLLDTIEARRETTKKPILDAGRLVDAHFKVTLAAKIEPVMASLRHALENYAFAEADKERLAKLEAARIAQEAAERMAAAAQRAGSQDAMDAAAELEQHAQTTSDQAASPRGGFEAGKATTELGSSVSIRGTWKHRITDPKKVPRSYCSPDDTLLKSAVKQATSSTGECSLKIPGVEIYFDRGVTIR